MVDRVKVLFMGDRAWGNREAIVQVLRKLPNGTIIVHGACATGADKIVDDEARKMPEKGFEIRPYPADWDGFAAKGNRKSAGPARNSEMLRKEHPDKDGVPIHQGFAFSGDLPRSRGTFDGVTKARAKGIKIDVVTGASYEIHASE